MEPESPRSARRGATPRSCNSVLRVSAGDSQGCMHYERHREHQPAAAQDHQDSGHFPTDEAATKLVWLALRNITTD